VKSSWLTKVFDPSEAADIMKKSSDLAEHQRAAVEAEQQAGESTKMRMNDDRLDLRDSQFQEEQKRLFQEEVDSEVEIARKYLDELVDEKDEKVVLQIKQCSETIKKCEECPLPFALEELQNAMRHLSRCVQDARERARELEQASRPKVPFIMVIGESVAWPLESTAIGA